MNEWLHLQSLIILPPRGWGTVNILAYVFYEHTKHHNATLKSVVSVSPYQYIMVYLLPHLAVPNLFDVPSTIQLENMSNFSY